MAALFLLIDKYLYLVLDLQKIAVHKALLAAVTSSMLVLSGTDLLC